MTDLEQIKKDNEALKDALLKAFTRIETLEKQMSTVLQGQAHINKKKFKVFSDKDFYELKQGNSWQELSELMGCSVSSCKRRVNSYKEKNGIL